ncbi:hypothetical protein [Parafrankia discariae]|uniref:hypothetical protein n=1 Tax=Parafrankia discariae TaxID=365528 RepID=UPI00036E90C4|nr:hypothetical protein [Parafrankia discariae]
MEIMRVGGWVATAQRLCRALLCAALVSTVAAGCTSSGDDPQPLPPAQTPEHAITTSSGPPETSKPIPTEVASNDAVQYDYGLFWQAFINAQVLGDADYPDLRKRAEGQALAFAQELVRAYRDNGWVRVIRDGFGTNPVVVARGDTTARVTDSQDWSKWPLTVRATGAIVPGSTPQQCFAADLVRRNDMWAVSRLTSVQHLC